MEPAYEERMNDLAQRLEVLQRAVQYAINRLDADKNQPQVAGDLAVALAYSKEREEMPRD
jgi:hypothetical protein